MKKYITILVILFGFIPLIVFSQSCFPDGITFSTQEEIDDFQTNNPNCTEIEGFVIISGSDEINNLNGLNMLTSIGGKLRIYSCSILTSLEGLENITSIGGDLDIYFWPSGSSILKDLRGLDNLQTIGGELNIQGTDSLNSLVGLENVTTIGGLLQISGNDALNNLMGLDNVTSIGEGIWIGENTVLDNLVGLENLTTIGGNIEVYTSSMTSLAGLDNLVSIGGGIQITYSHSLISLSALSNLTSMGGYLEIYDNEALSSLSGLDNIAAESITDILISKNPSLSTCEVKSVCDYLSSPNGNTDISDNASGCNSQLEVKNACGLSTEDMEQFNTLIVYPNPFSSVITIEYILRQPEKVSLTIYNYLGEIIDVVNENQLQGKQQIKWDADEFADGIYCFLLLLGDQTVNGKMVKMR